MTPKESALEYLALDQQAIEALGEVQRLRNVLVDIGVECTGTFDKRAVSILAKVEAALGKSYAAT